MQNDTLYQFMVVKTDKKIKIKTKHTVYENQWSTVTRTTFVRNKKEKEIYTTNFGKRSGVILFRKKRILLVKQYRLLIDDFSWEIPGGKVESFESFEQAAIRECKEETGFKCKSLDTLIKFHPGLETLNNPTKIFVSEDFRKIEDHDKTETEEISWFPIKKIPLLLEKNYFPDSLTLIGLLSFLRKYKST